MEVFGLPLLNIISLLGMFGLCAIAWIFSENRRLKYFPWRVVIGGIGLQLLLGALVFIVPGAREGLQIFSNILNSVFDAADVGARFVFGPNIVPLSGTTPAVDLGYIFAFRALPTVIFFGGLMALLYNIGIIQIVTDFFAKIFYSTMRLSGAESLSGAANIFVGIEAAIVVKPFLAKMTRSELCAILACCFGTSASSVLAIYVSFLRPVFPNILAHLVSASIIGIPACFVLSKILVPETEVPLTAGGIPREEDLRDFAADGTPEDSPQTILGEPISKESPLDAAIAGALDGVRMAVGIAAVLILILGLVALVNQVFDGLAAVPGPVGTVFQYVTLQNIMGALFLPFTVLTGVSLDWPELWQASVLIGRRLFETAIPSYQALGELGAAGAVTDRTILIVSYALSGFAHLASVGIFVGGTAALIPSRRRDIAEMGWKALFVGTLATLMIACVAGVFDNGSPTVLGQPMVEPPAVSEPAPADPVETLPPQDAEAEINTVPTETLSDPAADPPLEVLPEDEAVQGELSQDPSQDSEAVPPAVEEFPADGTDPTP
ncbi:MAG: nucleoside transporter C-terminal domain-containing protein [Elainellaceae cyanobacterium]